MVFQFLTPLIMDMFFWAFHDDADPRMGKNLLWFWQQALRCVLQCRAVTTLLSHNGSERQTKDTQKASVPGLFTFWHCRKLLIIIFPFPELPIVDVHGLKQPARHKISDIRVKNKSTMFKKYHPKCNNSTASSPGFFSITTHRLCPVEGEGEAAIVTLLSPVPQQHLCPWLFPKGM